MTTVTLSPNSRCTVTRIILLPSGHRVLVDEQDYGIVNPYTWYKHIAKGGKLVYARRKWVDPDGTQHGQLMHNLIMGFIGVDHVNHNGLDNRRVNLRPSDQRRNTQNSRIRSDNTSGYKGVVWHKQGGQWAVSIMVEPGKSINRVGFVSPEDAAKKYDELARIYFGEFASLNFPNTGGTLNAL